MNNKLERSPTSEKRRVFPRWHTIQARLLRTAVLIVLLLGLTIGTGTVSLAWRNGRRQIEDHLTSVATLKLSEIDAWVEILSDELNSAYNREKVRPNLPVLVQATRETPRYVTAYNTTAQSLSHTLAFESTFEELLVLDERGNVMLSTNRSSEGENRRIQPYFSAGLRTTETSVHVQTTSYSGTAADLNAIVVVKSIRDAGDNAIGVLVGIASLSRLNDIMAERAGLGQTGETYLVSSNGVMLTTSRFPDYQMGQLYVRTPGADAAIKDQTNGFGTYTSYHNRRVLGVYRWLPDLQVAFLAEQMVREAYRPIYITIILDIALNLGSMGLVILLLMPLVRSIATPIEELSQTVTRVAEGDLTQVASVYREDELGRLAQAFNSMTRRLRDMLLRERQLLHLESEKTAALEAEIRERQKTEAERQKLLEQVQAQAQQLQQVIDSVPEGVILLNKSHHVIVTNRLGETYLASLTPPGPGQPITRLGDIALKACLHAPPEGLWHEIDAAARRYQLIAQPFEVDSTPTGWVMVIRDVTQQVEYEQRAKQQERLAAVGQLAAGIAHDFNNIMAVVSLYAQLASRSPDLSKRDQERMQIINQQAQRATALIQQILDFSRKAVLERRPLNLAPLLKEQIKLLERTLPDHIIIRDEVDSEDAANGGSFIHADPTRVQQIVMNLALNARDAMPEGGTLTIGLERLDIRPGDRRPLPEMGIGHWLKLTVSDTGTGIAPDVLPHILEPFFTTKAKGLGNGLGLPQVYGIVGAHDGYLDVTTEVGVGTTISVYLPALSPDIVTLPKQESLQPLQQGAGQTILMVEDNASTRQALTESLGQLNYRVLEAANGKEALVLLTSPTHTIDLVLSDVVMPEMGGADLLRAIEQRGIEVPVILITGHMLEQEGVITQQEGGQVIARLTKPVSLEKLSAEIHRALSDEQGTMPHNRREPPS